VHNAASQPANAALSSARKWLSRCRILHRPLRESRLTVVEPKVELMAELRSIIKIAAIEFTIVLL
jgi:hypothetical protein